MLTEKCLLSVNSSWPTLSRQRSFIVRERSRWRASVHCGIAEAKAKTRKSRARQEWWPRKSGECHVKLNLWGTQAQQRSEGSPQNCCASWTNDEKSVLLTALCFSRVSACVHLLTVAWTWEDLRGVQVIFQRHQEPVCFYSGFGDDY